MKPCPGCKSDRKTGESWQEPRKIRIKCFDCGFPGPMRECLDEAKKAWDDMRRIR